MTAGGLDLAAEAAGIRTIAMCERDPFCGRVLMKYWPDVPIFEDIRLLRGEDIGAVDVIHGGFPCQPFSVAGNQKGKDDDRYLWPEFSRLVAEIKPRWVVAENVPGILKIAADDVCQSLERLGYAVGIWNFEAAAVGAPHRRARIFFVGYAEHYGLIAEPELRSHEKTGDNRRQEEQKTAGEFERTDRPADVPSVQGCECGSESTEYALNVQDAGRGMRERGAVSGTLCKEHGRGTATDVERSGGASIGVNSHAPVNRRREWAADDGRRYERGESGAWDRFTGVCPAMPHPASERLERATRTELQGQRGGFVPICEVVSNSNDERLQEQQSSVSKERERTQLRPTECSGRRVVKPYLGRVADGLPAWLDGYWVTEPDIPRTAKGIKDRVSRLRALGNAVVPAQAYPIFRAIVETENLFNGIDGGVENEEK